MGFCRRLSGACVGPHAQCVAGFRMLLSNFGVAGIVLGLAWVWTGTSQKLDAASLQDWDAAAAAAYLDDRQAWWMEWPRAARDHGTSCVSCHTTVPYALARTALRVAPTRIPSTVEGRLFESIERRVTAWQEVEPFYSDTEHRVGKSRESRGTEAILNALILMNRDAQAGVFAATTRQALNYLWELQLHVGEDSGAWPWLNFGLEPWETDAAQYLGAALAGVAIGTAPDDYVSEPRSQLGRARLVAYLSGVSDFQHLFNRLHGLWATTILEDGLTSLQQQSVITDTLGLQQKDGGWALSALGSFQRLDGTALDQSSDGYATGLVVFVLQRAGMSREDGRLLKGLNWLRAHQAEDGSWPASSLNKARNPFSARGRFMRDAATAYAVLALTGG